MLLLIAFKIVEEGPFKLKKRAWNKCIREALEHGVDFWHSRIAKLHFRPSAVSRYGYQQRTARYQARKRRRFGHGNPLEYTGRAKRSLLRYLRITSRAGPAGSQATGSFDAPRYFWQTPPGHPKKAREFLTVRKDEMHRLAKAMDAKLQKALDAERTRVTTVIK